MIGFKSDDLGDHGKEQLIHTLFNINIVDSEINIAIPVRIRYKQSRKLGKIGSVMQTC